MGNVNKIYRPFLNRIQTHSASDHRDRWIKQTGHSSLCHYNILQLSTDSWPFASVSYWNSTTWGPRSECNRAIQPRLRVVNRAMNILQIYHCNDKQNYNFYRTTAVFMRFIQIEHWVKRANSRLQKTVEFGAHSYHSSLNNSHCCDYIISSMRWSIHAVWKVQTRNSYRSYTDNLGKGGTYGRIMCDVKWIQLAQVIKQWWYM